MTAKPIGTTSSIGSAEFSGWMALRPLEVPRGV